MAPDEYDLPTLEPDEVTDVRLPQVGAGVFGAGPQQPTLLGVPAPGSGPGPGGVREDGMLGWHLLQATPMKRQELDDALATQKIEGGRIGEILLRMRAITEEQLLRALGTQLGYGFDNALTVEKVDVTLLEQVPINFAKQHQVLPLTRAIEDPGLVYVACGDPLDIYALDEVRGLLGASELLPVIAPAGTIVDIINKVYARQSGGELAKTEGGDGDEEGGQAEELVDILDLTDEAPIIRWVNSLMFQAVKDHASDIHIEPGEKEVTVRYRMDGELYFKNRAPKQFMPSIISRVKIMAGLNIAEKRMPQDGRIRRKIAGKDIDMRVATIPIAAGGGGERITIRLLDRTAVLLDMADIGFSPDHQRAMEELIRRPHGILLVTGPTGSGKTTTLYSALTKINSPNLNILTIEDPVEYQLEGVSQTQVNPKIELTFAAGLRSFLRHDPDVIMVGEIRDVETAEIAIQASLTGHLVFSTIHTNDAAGGVTRLVEMGVEPFLVASSLIGLLAQRLVRRVCKECREPYRPLEDEVRRLGIDWDAFQAGNVRPQGFKNSQPPPPGMLYRAKGCARCLGTGYSGRTGIYELLLMNDDIRTLALKNADSGQLKRAAVAKGMKTLRDDGAAKVIAGMTTAEEVMMATAEDRG